MKRIHPGISLNTSAFEFSLSWRHAYQRLTRTSA